MTSGFSKSKTVLLYSLPTTAASAAMTKKMLKPKILNQ